MEGSTGQEAHLGESAFAGMSAQSVWQDDYLRECQQLRSSQDVPTPSAVCTFTAEEV